MITRNSIFRMFSVLFIAVFLLMGVLPVQAEALGNPHYASGDFLWAKGMGGPNQDEGNSITVDSAGNVYTTGDFQNTVDFDPGTGIANLTSAGGADIFISKSDSDGNFLWAKNMGGVGGDDGICIAVDSNGNIYTIGDFTGTADFDPNAGTSSLTSAGGRDIFVSKLDGNGNFVWAKNMGGTYSDVGLDITLDSSGNVYTTGGFVDTADFDPGVGVSNLSSAGSADIFVSKLDSNGGFVWAKSMGGMGKDDGLEIRLDSNGNIYTIGRFENTADFDPGASAFNLTSAGLSDSFISKLDHNGNFVWAKSMGGADYDDGYSIALDSNDNIYAMGGFSGTADFDPGPGIFNLTSAGYEDIFISKLDADGNLLWAKSIGGTDYDYGGTIALDSGNNIYMTGDYSGTVDFDSGTGITNLVSVGGSTDIFVSKSDSSGNFVWAKSMGGTWVDSGFSIAVDLSGSIYTTGFYSDTADFDPGPGISNLTSAGDWDIFVSKLFNDSVAPIVTSSVRASASPTNLASVDFTVTFSEPVTGVVTGDFSLTTTAGISGATVSGVSGSGSVYTVTVNTGSGDGTIRLDVVDDNSIVDAASNQLGGVALGDGNFASGEVYTVNKSSIFADVPLSYWSWSFIERLYNAGITGGCTTVPLNYCPTNSVTRAQMAIFLVRAMHGVAFVPPTATGVFSDVPVGSFGADYIEQLAADSITSGCGGGNFCPGASVTRAQMAIFLVRAMHGIAFVPPTATGVFSDVPVGSFGADYIEQLAADSITSGCGAGIYCPSTTVKRDSMAVFLVRAFNLP
ncbi:MAG: SBBP repeat-containing protein [Chloroflexi bacterium]|nr:SBBP repeat-containing protein [Chloroflexota bacterium]